MHEHPRIDLDSLDIIKIKSKSAFLRGQDFTTLSFPSKWTSQKKIFIVATHKGEGLEDHPLHPLDVHKKEIIRTGCMHPFKPNTSISPTINPFRQITKISSTIAQTTPIGSKLAPQLHDVYKPLLQFTLYVAYPTADFI